MDADKIQYAVLGTNAVNVFMTIICVSYLYFENDIICGGSYKPSNIYKF